MGRTAQAREEKVGAETDGQRRRAGRGYLDEIMQEKERSQEIANAHSAAARVGPGQMGWMTMMEERTAHARQGMDWQGQAGKARPGRDETRQLARGRTGYEPLHGRGIILGVGRVEGGREGGVGGDCNRQHAHACQAQAGSAGRGRQRCNTVGLWQEEARQGQEDQPTMARTAMATGVRRWRGRRETGIAREA